MASGKDPRPPHDPLSLFGGGEMGERTRAFDWSQTPLGPVAGWSQSLKTAVRIMLGSRYAMWLGWGPEFTFFYNDAYARMTLGPKHPWALGRPAREVWAEIWDDIGPRATSVLRTGQATWDEGLLLFLERRGFPEETYHTFSYSPVPDDQGGVGGLLCVVTEDTARTIGERRLRTLRELAARTTEEAKSADDACQSAARTLAENPYDLPFLLIYLLDGQPGTARLAGATGLAESAPAAPPRVALRAPEGGEAVWPFNEFRESGSAVEVITDLESRFGPLQCRPWPEPVRQAVVVPIAKPGQARPAGFLVAGVSPRLAFDDAYLGFLGLLAGQVGTAVANAQAYEEERRRAEALAELDRAKTAFFSNVSHEFRTPLTLMLGPVEDLLARSYTELSPATKSQLEVVNRNGLRLLRLVNTLLDFSRIEAGRVRAVYQPTDLAAFTAELASVFRAACERAGLRLVVDCPKLPEPVYVDRDMWEKIVLNLLSNAFKFTFDGAIEVSLRPGGRVAELRVRDTGTGIPPEEMPRLFERFHRVESARGRTHEGSGIGLALVQELVKLHGGTITAESEVGRGTTFTIAIPVGSAHLPPDQVGASRTASSAGTGATPYVEEALRWLPAESDAELELPAYEEPLPVPHPSHESDEHRPRVLVADDNADMRQYIARLLAEHYHVTAVADGAAALAAARQRTPDLVLTDVMMPQLDGFGLLRELRADPRTRGLPVILLSARAGEESRVEGLEAGADDYLVKPFGARELLARVSAHLQMARLRREASETLRVSEERFQLFMDHSPTTAFIKDSDGRYVYINRVVEREFGRPPTDWLGKTDAEVFPPAEAEAIRRNDGVVIATGTTAQFVETLTRSDGTHSYLSFKFPIQSRDGQWLLAGMSLDVTEQRRAEAAVRRRSEQLHRLAEVATRLNAAGDVASITGVVTEEARILIGAHQAVTGFTADENWGQAINTVSLTDKYAAWRGYEVTPDGSGIYGLVCQTNRPVRLTQAELEAHPAYQALSAQAARHPPLRGWLGAPLVGRDGRNLGLIQLSDKYEGDFTEEDEAILVQLAQMASVALGNARLVTNLREADRRKDEFLATLAHELRNPLAPLRNGLQVMKLVKGNSAGLEQSRAMMERQLSQMVRLVDDLMDVSRITRDRLELRLERIELARVVEQAVETSRPLVEAGGHQLAVELPGEPLFVDADLARLAQVISNLLNNAAKYTERGGRITLTARRDGGSAEVRVRDTGIGIPAAMLPRVFDMFTQVDRSLEKAQGGLGIGLTLVKRLTEMHGGSVEARSAGQGQGSEFVVRLPALSSGPPREHARADAGRPASRRILVVDDNRDSAESLALVLGIMGNETQTAHDGLDALRVAEAFRPDVILLDIGMPKLNGYDAARRLRQEAWGKGIALVALTGWGQEEDRRRSQDAGFNFHLVKPVEPAALERLLAELQAPAP